MDALVPAIFVLACPVAMVLVMLWMHRGHRGGGKGGAE